MRIAPLGDSAVVVTVGNSVDEATLRRVRAIHEHLQRTPAPGQIECVPAFASVVVHYDPARVELPAASALPYDVVAAAIESAVGGLRDSRVTRRRTMEIPVCYGGQLGPDLDDVAGMHQMTPEQVIREHSSAKYVVYLLGFLPGFPYLGGLPERIATRRRATPRTLVPAGSVGIGGAQTGIYSMDSPGGWNIIGRTPLALFSPERPEPALLRAGDAVRFRAISVEEYERLLLRRP